MKFWIGMGSRSIQKVSSVVMQNSGLGHPNLEYFLLFTPNDTGHITFSLGQTTMKLDGS
jgi:hypothetical protein